MLNAAVEDFDSFGGDALLLIFCSVGARFHAPPYLLSVIHIAQRRCLGLCFRVGRARLFRGKNTRIRVLRLEESGSRLPLSGRREDSMDLASQRVFEVQRTYAEQLIHGARDAAHARMLV